MTSTRHPLRYGLMVVALCLAAMLSTSSPAGAENRGYYLNVGGRLNEGDWLSRDTDGSGWTSLVMQDDGNLVLYANEGTQRRPCWSTQTFTSNPVYAIYQGDGNFVVYEDFWWGDFPLWSSRTNGTPAGNTNIARNGAVWVGQTRITGACTW